MSAVELVDVVGSIYEAGLESDRWGVALEHLSSFVGAERGMVGLTNVSAQTADVFATFRIDPALLARWAQEFASEDPWSDGARGLEEGDIARGHELVPLVSLLRKPVYLEIAEPAGMHDVIVSIVAKRQRELGWVNLYQGQESGLFSSAAVERVARVFPHLQRAARIHARFAELETRSRADAAALDSLSCALLTCDREGRVLTANARAEQLLREADVLSLRDGRVRARTTEATACFDLLVADAAATSIGRGARGGGAMSLDRGDGARPLSLLVSPVSERLEEGVALVGDRRPAVVVLISDPDRRIELPDELLRELFGLTPAESRLARALAAGESAAEHALAEGIQPQTARWHLKRILAKTDTGRQAELVSLLHRTLPPLQR